MDRLETQDWKATRDRLKAILGIEGDSGNTNAELAAKVADEVERLRRRHHRRPRPAPPMRSQSLGCRDHIGG